MKKYTELVAERVAAAAAVDRVLNDYVNLQDRTIGPPSSEQREEFERRFKAAFARLNHALDQLEQYVLSEHHGTQH